MIANSASVQSNLRFHSIVLADVSLRHTRTKAAQGGALPIIQTSLNSFSLLEPVGGSAPKFSSGAIEQLLVEDSTSTALLCAAQAAPPPAFRWKIRLLSEENEIFYEICAQILVLVCSACCQLYICTTRRNNWSRFYCSTGAHQPRPRSESSFLAKSESFVACFAHNPELHKKFQTLRSWNIALRQYLLTCQADL